MLLEIGLAATTRILVLLTIDPIFDGGVPTDALLLAQFLLDSAVNIEKCDIGIRLFSMFRDGSPSGAHTSAVTSPRSEELNETILSRVVDLLLEISHGELGGTAGRSGGQPGKGEELEHC